MFSNPSVCPQARHFTTLASSVDRDVNVGPIGRNWLRRWFQTLIPSFTFYIYISSSQNCQAWNATRFVIALVHGVKRSFVGKLPGYCLRLYKINYKNCCWLIGVIIASSSVFVSGLLVHMTMRVLHTTNEVILLRAYQSIRRDVHNANSLQVSGMKTSTAFYKFYRKEKWSNSSCLFSAIHIFRKSQPITNPLPIITHSRLWQTPFTLAVWPVIPSLAL